MYNNNISTKNKIYNKYSIVDFPSDGQLYGNFISTNPKKAANKAFSSLMQFMNIDENQNDDFFMGKFIVFVIKNRLSGKTYKYIGNRIKLKNSVKVIKNGKEIEYKYKNIIGKYKKELELI